MDELNSNQYTGSRSIITRLAGINDLQRNITLAAGYWICVKYIDEPGPPVFGIFNSGKSGRSDYQKP